MLNFADTLNTEGEFFSNWRTQFDFLFGHGKEIDENTFILENTGTHDNLVYYFPTIEDLKEIYNKSGFEIINMELEEFTEKNMERKNSWYNVLAKKI